MMRTVPIVVFLLLVAVACRSQDSAPRLVLEEGKSGAVWDLALSADGKTLYSCGRDSTAKSWNLETGEGIRTFRCDPSAPATCLALDPSGTLLAVGDVNGTLSLWETRTGVKRFELAAHTRHVLDLDWSPDGSSIISAGRDDSVHSWSAADGALQSSWCADALWIHGIAVRGGAGSSGSGVAPQLVFAAQDGSIRSRGLDGTGDHVWGRHSRFAHAVCSMPAGPNERYFCSGGRDGRIKIWDTDSRALFREFQLGQGYPHALLPLGDGSELLVCKMNGLAEVWDWRRGRLLRELPPGSYGTMKAVADDAARRLYTAHTSGAIRVWNLDDNSLLMDMVGFSDGQWLTFSPDGYFDCSAYGSRYVSWQQGDETYPFASYESVYRRPEIVEAVLGGTRNPSSEMRRLIAAPTVSIASPRNGQIFSFGSEALEVVVDIEVQDRLGVGTIALFLNGRRMDEANAVSRSIITKSDSSRLERWRIEVLPGSNTISAVAWNTARIRSLPAHSFISVETAEQINPSLFVLAVGSDRYSPSYPDLRYASLDAESIAAEFSRQEGGMYTRVYTAVVSNTQADRTGILDALNTFPAMKPNDVLVLFFSGHGVRLEGPGGALRYYFVPAGVAPAEVPKKAISWNDIVERLQKVRAGRVILLLDACRSGDVSSGASNEKVATELKGSIGLIFTSSSGSEFSFEDPALGHGVFTAALLEAMQGKADVTGDGIVDWNELQLYVTNRVRAVTQGGQNPSVPFLEQFANFDVVRVP